jgi:predicted metal-dependent HD superfamily phosphohydrolase
MSAAGSVQAVWNDIVRRHGKAGAAADAILSDLVRAYAEPHRHYHTLEHIATLLGLLDKHGATVADRDAIRLAILFHDAVYDPARSNNEAASAALAACHLAGLHLAPPLIADVKRFILATRHGPDAEPAAADADLALLLDLDLAVLAAAWPEYLTYTQQIRREYAIYPDAIYRPGRRRVLEAFLARPRLYHTERLRGAVGSDGASQPRARDRRVVVSLHAELQLTASADRSTGRSSQRPRSRVGRGRRGASRARLTSGMGMGSERPSRRAPDPAMTLRRSSGRPSQIDRITTPGSRAEVSPLQRPLS